MVIQCSNGCQLWAGLAGNFTISRRPGHVQCLLADADPCSQVDRWGACGGLTAYAADAADPSACCPTGTTCRPYDAYFWQCQPNGYTLKAKPVGTWPDTCTGSKVGGASPMLSVLRFATAL